MKKIARKITGILIPVLMALILGKIGAADLGAPLREFVPHVFIYTAILTIDFFAWEKLGGPQQYEHKNSR